MTSRGVWRRIMGSRVDLLGDGESVLEEPFREAVREAQLLLYYASRRGIELDASIVTKTVEAAYSLKKGADITATRQIEEDFWPAFQELAKAVRPITIDSVKATYDGSSMVNKLIQYCGCKVPLTRLSAILYSLGAIGTLIVVIAIQMYWVVGVSVTNEAVVLGMEITRLVEEQRERAEEIGQNNIAGDLIFNTLGGQIQQNEQWLVAAHTTLERWNQWWRTVVPGLVDSTGSDTSEDATVRARIAVTSAGFVLEALSTYLIPLLYGVLGAFAYVLRELVKEIREVTFTDGSLIRYRLRLSLGLLAGIAVGFLTSADAAAQGGVEATQAILSLTTLGPIALAFLAGYSVELVFATMDRIVSAFVYQGSRENR